MSRFFTSWIPATCLLLLAIGPGPALAGPWNTEFVLQDFMQIYDFPEDLVNYPVAFLPRAVRTGGLRLIALHGKKEEPVTFQLSDVIEKDGFLEKATVSFRTDLPKKASRRFRLTHDAKQGPPPDSKVGIRDKKDGTAILSANLLRVRVPFGQHKFLKPIALYAAPAPILAVARGAGPDAWCLAGSFQAKAAPLLTALDTFLLADGPLFARYRIVYTFDKGRKYTVELTLRHNEKFVTIDEYLEGLQPHDEAYLKIDFTPGFGPDRREVMSNGGYEAQGYSGPFDKNGDGAGKLPFELGLNRPNSMGVMRSAAFYRDKGEHALLLCLYRLRDWKTAYRHVWYANTGPGNLNFFTRGKDKYLLTRLEGRERHWALGLIPRIEYVHVRNTPGQNGRGPAGGPEVRLWQKLADFSLDNIKNWVFDWDEPLETKLFPEGRKISYQQWLQSYGLDAQWWFLNAIVNFYWDFSAEVGPPSFGLMPGFFGDYERSRAQWTPEQRKHVRAILLFLTYTAEDDNNLPHHSMLAGQPNFVMQVKQTLGIACGVFPTHPHAKKWRDSFRQFFHEWVQTYGRKADPEHNALGGRWTENIACYSGTSLEALWRAAKGIRFQGGPDLLDHPALHDWVRWYLNAFMSPHDGVRRVPPEGAHASGFEAGSPYWKTLFEIAPHLKTSAPQLSAHMRWIETGGKEGTRPDLKSVLIRDYGPVLRHDFGGPREAYLHLMQIAGPYNYRWGSGSGVLYYGAKNKNWSYNGTEDNGDAFDINLVSSFSAGGKSLGPSPTEGPLYDFDFAQFYRAAADPVLAKKTKYRSRGIMMLRDDYIVVHDDMEGEGQFTWSSGGDMPQIYQLRPGAAAEAAAGGRIRRYRGRGDFLTVIAPAALKARATKFGAVVNETEYLFVNQAPIAQDDGKVLFQGTVGYARPNQLALFAGTRLRLGGFEIRREGGDFGVSAAVIGNQIKGRFAGRQGGRVGITPPRGFAVNKAKVTLGSDPVRTVIDRGTIWFDVTIGLRDGVKSFTISF